MSSKFWAELSSDYEKLFETEIGYDVIIFWGSVIIIPKKFSFLAKITFSIFINSAYGIQSMLENYV
jgi:hypothetical protein